jgi:hypothetical protein
MVGLVWHSSHMFSAVSLNVPEYSAVTRQAEVQAASTYPQGHWLGFAQHADSI